MFYLGSVQPDYLRFCLQSEILARCHLKRKLFENLMKRPFFVVAFSLCLSHRIQFAFRVFVVGRSQSVFCLGTPNSLSEARFFGVLGSGSWVFSISAFFPQCSIALYNPFVCLSVSRSIRRGSTFIRAAINCHLSVFVRRFLLLSGIWCAYL